MQMHSLTHRSSQLITPHQSLFPPLHSKASDISEAQFHANVDYLNKTLCTSATALPKSINPIVTKLSYLKLALIWLLLLT